jgi:hypothetical protein
MPVALMAAWQALSSSGAAAIKQALAAIFWSSQIIPQPGRERQEQTCLSSADQTLFSLVAFHGAGLIIVRLALSAW